MATGKVGPAKFAVDGGLLVAIGATTVEQTGLIVGGRYRATAHGGMALVRLGADDASIADGGFDFAVGDGESVDFIATDAALNVIEADADSAANAILAVSRYADDF